jgi:hypothetical protein
MLLANTVQAVGDFEQVNVVEVDYASPWSAGMDFGRNPLIGGPRVWLSLQFGAD